MIEAVSFLLLLGVAMPLKYLADQPEAVSVVGMAHGLLFIALLLTIAFAWSRGLSGKLATLAGVASVIPTGPFWIDPALRRAQQTQNND